MQQSVIETRRAGWCCGLAFLFPLAFATGCGKVPTWNDLTQQSAPQPAPRARTLPAPVDVQPAPAPSVPTVVEPPKLDPAIVLATFRALQPYEISDAALAELGTLTEGLETIREIDATGSGISGAGIASLSKLPALRKLNLSTTKVSNDDLKHLTQFPALETLALNSTRVSDAGLSTLNGCLNLKTLELKNCSLTRNGFAAIGQLPVLEELNLEASSGINDLTLDLICDARTIRRLDLRDCGGFTDAGMAALAKLEVLEELNINRSAVTSEGFLPLTKGGGLKHIKLLGISVTPMTDKGSKAINSLKSLEHLDLKMVQGINDTGLSQIVTGMKYLKHINISHCTGITGQKAFAALRGCDGLEVLLANLTGINDASLGHLKSHKQLKMLDVNQTKCTAGGVLILKKALPDCEIHFANQVY